MDVIHVAILVDTMQKGKPLPSAFIFGSGGFLPLLVTNKESKIVSDHPYRTDGHSSDEDNQQARPSVIGSIDLHKNRGTRVLRS